MTMTVDCSGLEPESSACDAEIFPLDQQPVMKREVNSWQARKESNPLPQFWSLRCDLRSDPFMS